MDRKLDALLFSLMQNMTIAVSGEKLACDLGVSHSTLVRWIDKLRKGGVDIRGELFTGYRLLRLPDVVLPQLIRPRLRTAEIGRNLYHFYKVDSTNAFAARLLEHEHMVPNGTVVLAETQSAGRGRLGRIWHSEPEAGLYFSIILHPRIPSSLAPLFTLGTAVALHDAVERHTGLEVDIKWPNDLLIGGRKAAGILAEMQAEIDMVHTLIIGVGLNVNHGSFPPDLADLATSLRIASGQPHSRIEILIGFFEHFEQLCGDFEKFGAPAIINLWTRSSSFAHGRSVEIYDGVRRVGGVTRGLNPLGALRVEKEDGTIEEVYSGDVVRWQQGPANSH